MPLILLVAVVSLGGRTLFDAFGDTTDKVAPALMMLGGATALGAAVYLVAKK